MLPSIGTLQFNIAITNNFTLLATGAVKIGPEKIYI